MDRSESEGTREPYDRVTSRNGWGTFELFKHRHPVATGCLICVVAYVCLNLAGLLAFDIYYGEFPSSRAWEDKILASERRSLDLEIHPISKIDEVIETHSKWEKKPDVHGDEREVLICQQDIDGDGILDSFVSGQGFGFHFTVSGNPKAFPRNPLLFPSGDTSLGFDDVDGDGCTDAWYCDPGDMVMVVYWGNNEMTQYRRQGVGAVPYTAKGAFFDVDGDGDLDVVLKVENPETAPQYSWIKLRPK